DLLVGRVRRGPVLVADRRREDAVEFPEQALRAPEAAESEVGDLDSLRERRLQRRAENRMGLRDVEAPLAAPWQRLVRADQLRLLRLHHLHQLSKSVHLN